MNRGLRLVTCLFGLLPSSLLARTITVRPDGGGDYPTIQAAVNASQDGDVIELASGAFTGAGNRNVVVSRKILTIRSQTGDPSDCVIDCQHAGRAFTFDLHDWGAAMEGVTITNGSADQYGAVDCGWDIGVTFTDCIFYRNTTSDYCGGVGGAEHTAFVRCQFIENSARTAGAFGAGAMAYSQLSEHFDQCAFIGNTASYAGGAIHLEAVELATADREVAFANCTFANNRASSGSAVYLLGMSPGFDHCTFAGNVASDDATISCLHSQYAESSPTFLNTIIASSAGGAAIGCGSGNHPTFNCSDLYGNEGGDWINCIADQLSQRGNISSDPLFCDPAQGDYALQDGSPWSPEQNPTCGLVGAWPVGCGGPVPVSTRSWGAIKLLYR